MTVVPFSWLYSGERRFAELLSRFRALVDNMATAMPKAAFAFREVQTAMVWPEGLF